MDLSIARGRSRVIVINESWRLAPWADVLYGCDNAFWVAKKGVPEFGGLKVTQDRIASAKFPDVKLVACKKEDELIFELGAVGWGGNSGFQAINLALQFGVNKIILVGYDMRLDRGLHWHGKHPVHMNNPMDKNIERWRRAVDSTAPVLRERGIEAVNSSQVSALTAFPKRTWEDLWARPPVMEAVKPMKVLAIGQKYAGPHELTSFYEVHSYYLQRELPKLGAELMLYPREPNPAEYFERLPVEEADHLLGFGLRYFDKNFTRDTLKPIRQRMKNGAGIFQYSDQPRLHTIADMVFSGKSDAEKPPGKRFAPFCPIGWAADPDVCRSEQQASGPLRILLDHPDYDPKRRDVSKELAASIDGLRRSRDLRRAGFEGVETSWLTSPKGGAPPIPFSEIVRQYSQAHIFVMTHQEAVGLSAIEAATSGCLVVSPKGFLAKELVATIRRIELDDLARIPWAKILTKIDPAASRKKAMVQSWSLMAERLVAGMRSFGTLVKS